MVVLAHQNHGVLNNTEWHDLSVAFPWDRAVTGSAVFQFLDHVTMRRSRRIDLLDIDMDRCTARNDINEWLLYRTHPHEQVSEHYILRKH